MNPTNAIVQLNKYDREKYNVLVPVTTMQVASNLQRITVSEVQLDVRQNSSNNGPSKDIYGGRRRRYRHGCYRPGGACHGRARRTAYQGAQRRPRRTFWLHQRSRGEEGAGACRRR